MFDSFQDFWEWGDGILASLCIAILTLVLFFLAARLLARKIIPWLQKKIDDDKHPVIHELLVGFSQPVVVYLRFAGVCAALLILCTHLDNEQLPSFLLQFFATLQPIVLKALRVGLILIITWGLIASSDLTAIILRRARHKLDIHMRTSVSHFLTAVFNVIVIAVAATILLSEFGINISGIIAGLGLGGLTIALAAQDSASNFFGGLVLVMEKPFEIGDWIVCKDVEGSVEDINLRSTKIRTTSGSLTVMPNATLAAAPISNWGSDMEKRRADFVLNMEYGADNKQMRAFINQIKGILEADPEIIQDSVNVRFAELGESSLNVRVIFYTTMPGFADHLRVRERVNFALVDLAERNGMGFAYPTRTLYVRGRNNSVESAADTGNEPKPAGPA